VSGNVCGGPHWDDFPAIIFGDIERVYSRMTYMERTARNEWQASVRAEKY